MSHMVDSIGYVGETPWHKLGKRLTEEHARDVPWFFQESGLGWSVGMIRAQWYSPVDADYRVSHTHNVVVREDTCDQLGMCGKKYEPLQNIDMAHSLQKLCLAGIGTVEVAGALYGGRVVWALIRSAKLEPFEVGEGDTVLPYLLAVNSHDGKSRASIRYTPVRVVCHNTLSIAGDAGISYMTHTGDTGKKFDDLVSIAHNKHASAVNAYDQLRSMFMYKGKIRTIFQEVGMWDDVKDCPTRTGEQVLHYAEHGKGNRGETLWDLYNGYTEFSQFTRPKRLDGFFSYVDSSEFLKACLQA